MDTFTTSSADGVMSDGTIAFNDGVLTALSASQTRLLIAGEVSVRCAWYTCLTDGVGAASTRADGADSRWTGRTRPAEPASSLPSTVAVTATLLVCVFAMAEEAGRTVTVHWWLEASSQWYTY